jgi:hypothetical protein
MEVQECHVRHLLDVLLMCKVGEEKGGEESPERSACWENRTRARHKVRDPVL